MGGKGSKAKQLDPTEKKANQSIDEQLWKDKSEDQELIKLLLLGAGESGKSTLFKQMIKIYGTGFSAKDKQLYVPMIWNNTIQAMKELCIQSSNRRGDYEVRGAAAQEAFKEFVSDAVKPEQKLTPQVAQMIRTLWADAGIRNTHKLRSQFQLVDSAQYFFENAERLAGADYVPTDEDLIRCRVRTTGIVEHRFEIDKNRFLMVDVGGQRNERKKWIHCFEGVTAVIFVAALSEYDQVLYEDGKTNRMDEALELFQRTAESSYFENTSFILFLNKEDLFRAKIGRGPDKVPFSAWSGAANMSAEDAADPERAIEYLTRVFETKFSNSKEKLYIRVTCATDSTNVKTVFTAVKDIILQHHLKESGLL